MSSSSRNCHAPYATLPANRSGAGLAMFGPSRSFPAHRGPTMAITRQVITSLQRDGTDMLGTKNVAIKIIDESIVSGSLLTVESNHFCVLKSRGAVLNVYETGQYALTTPDKPLGRLDRPGLFRRHVALGLRSHLHQSLQAAGEQPRHRDQRRNGGDGLSGRLLHPCRHARGRARPHHPSAVQRPGHRHAARSPIMPGRRSSRRSIRSSRSPRWRTSTSASARSARG